MKNHTHYHPTPADLTASEKLSPAVIRQLSQLKPGLAVGHIFLEHFFILSAAVLCTMYWHPLLYVVTVMWIGARQHALAIILHDGAHYRITRNKKLNDFIGETMLAFPLFVTMRGYRLSHNAHHRNMNTEHDPDWVSKETPEWVFPKSRLELFTMLLKLALGLNIAWMVRMIVSGGRPNVATRPKVATRPFIIGRIGFYLGLVFLFTYFGWWSEFLLFWIVPLFTWLQVIMRVRSIAEHFGLEYDHVFTSARTTYPSLFDRIFLASKNVWYHLDHHLYPSVPFYNLNQLHQELMALPAYRDRAHLTQSYLGVLKECVGSDAQDRKSVV